MCKFQARHVRPGIVFARMSYSSSGDGRPHFPREGLDTVLDGYVGRSG